MMATQLQTRRAGCFGVWWALAVMLVLLPEPLRAIDRFDVFVGFNDYVPESSWFPVICEIENQGPIFSGAIEVTGGGFNQGAERVVPIELPTGTTKRVTVPVFAEQTFGRGWNVRLLDSNGREVQAKQIPVRRNIQVRSVLLAAVSRDNVWTPPLQKLKVERSELEPAAARLLPALLPENPIVLEGLDAIYLNSERVTELRQGQRDAIERWIRMGGHLIVGVEGVADVNSSPWLRQLVPARLTGVTTIERHRELQEWLRSRVPYGPDAADPSQDGEVRPGPPSVARPFADREDHLEFEVAKLQIAVAEPVAGRVLVSAGEHPLILQRPHGLGRVTLLTFSPEREPFRSWRNLPTLWSRLTEVPPEWYASTDYSVQGGWSADGIFGAMIDSRQIRKLPVGWLLLLLLAYLVVIGPFDRWWLRKIGRPMLTWITFPLYVVLFSGLIYVIGYKLRAGEREWNELHLVDVVGGGGSTDWRGRTYGSLYSPVNATYRLAAPEKLAVLRAEAASSWGSGGGNERLYVVQREESFESEAYVPVWTSQLYVNEWWAEGGSPLRVTLVPRRDGLTCRLENVGQADLSGLRLVIHDLVYELGELAAGESSEQTLLTSNGRPLAEVLLSMGAGNYHSIVSARGQAFGAATSGRIDDIGQGCFVASFLNARQGMASHEFFQVQPGLELTRALRDNAVLLAFARGRAVEPSMKDFRASRGRVDTVWRVTVPFPSQHNL